MKRLWEGLLNCILWATISLIAWSLFTLLVLPCRHDPESYPPRVSPRGLLSGP
jgi:hypothetical protein